MPKTILDKAQKNYKKSIVIKNIYIEQLKDF